MGECVANDWQSYKYLAESIAKFPTQGEFKKMIKNAGFQAVTFENLTFGVCSIHSGFKLWLWRHIVSFEVAEIFV